MDLASDDFEEPNLKRPRPQPINEDKENKVNLEEKDKEEQIEDDTEESGEDDGSEGCPICFEAWATSGFHRLVSLKCGHLFGKRCIERWLSNGARNKCPQCNAPAKRSDIRVLYAKRLIAIDTSERDGLLRQLQEERVLKRMAMEAEARATVALQAVQCELDRTKADMERLKRRLLTLNDSDGSSDLPVFEYYRSFQLANQVNACRCLDIDAYYATVLFSKAHSSSDHGIGKASLLDASVAYIHGVHSALIRAISHSPFQDGLLLSTGNDKRLALTSLSSNTVIHAFHLKLPGWSCTFDPNDPNRLYAGLVNGTIAVFDIRNTMQQLAAIAPETPRRLPIHSMFISSANDIYGANLDGPFRYNLPDDRTIVLWDETRGNCTSASFDRLSDSLMATFRSAEEPTQVCIFDEPRVNFSTRSPQTIMSRSLLFSVDGKRLAVTPDEPSAALHFYDLASESGPRLCAQMETRSPTPILDIRHGKTEQLGNIVCALTGTDLFVMRQRNVE